MWGAVIGAGISLLGGAMGANSAKKARAAQQRYLNEMRQLYGMIDIPSIEDQQINLLPPELVGQMSPEEIQALTLGPAAMEDVAADPEAIASQEEALAQISELAEGGVTEADKATMREIRRDVGQSAKTRRDAILSEMAQRGVLGSGMELAAQLKGEQQATQTESEAADRAIQAAQARAMQALAQKGSMSGQMRSQSFGEEAARRQAEDAISRFNVANQQNIMAQNVAARNQAQLTNLQARQAIENERARLRNVQEQHNKALLQQQFQNEMAKAAGMSGAASAAAQAAGQQATGAAQMGAGMVSAGMGMVGSAFSPQSQYYSNLNKLQQQKQLDNEAQQALNQFDSQYGTGQQPSPFKFY